MVVNILIIHGNFPGQFLHLAPYLVTQGHKVVFLTESDNSQALRLHGGCNFFTESFRINLAKAKLLYQKHLYVHNMFLL